MKYLLALLVFITAFAGTAQAATILFPSGGGTGWANIQTGAIPYGQGTSRLATTSQGTLGYVLAWLNGIPTWVATSSIQNITLTTTGSSGASTLIGNTLNIPQYSGGAGTPGGATPQLQYNANGAFGGVSTSTLTGGSQVAVSNSPVIIGSSGAVLSIVADSIGDTQLAFNTGQNLTTASSPTFAGLTLSSPLTIANGGTGSTTAPASWVLYGGSNGTYQARSTTSASCSGTVSCSAFDIFGTTPVTITGSGGGSTGLSTTSPTNNGELLWYTAVGAGSARSTATTTLGGGTTGLSFSNSPVILGTSASALTGTLTVANGGTGSTTAVSGQVFYGGGSGLTHQSVATSSLSAGSGISFTGTPGALVGGTSLTISSSGGKQLSSWNVAASGGDYTTIQAALDQCGVVGGGWIQLLDTTYAQGATGLTFKGSNCHVMGRGVGTTTISFTGATTYWKTNSAAGQYSNNSIENITLSGDGNTSSIAFNLSDMTHFRLENTTVDNVGTWVRYDDTQNISFYNTLRNNQATTLTAFGLNASSTNPWNGNIVEGNFIGCSANNCVGIQMTNANGNRISDNYIEPDGTKTGVVDIKIFDNNIATCNGVFNNSFSGNYIEGGTVAGTQGFSIASGLCVNGGIQRNHIHDNTNENHTLDWAFPSATSTIVGLQTFINNYNSNFTNTLTSLEGPVGIGTSTELENIGQTPFAFFGISPRAGVASNAFVIGSSTKTLLKIDNSGNLTLGTTTAGCLQTNTVGLVSAITCSSGGGTPGGSGTEIQYRSGASTFGAVTSSAFVGTSVGFGTTSPWATLSVSTTTANSTRLPLFAVASTTGSALFTVFNDGASAFGTSTISTNSYFTVGTTTTTALDFQTSGKIGIGCRNNSAAKISIGPCDSNTLINPNFGFIAQNPGGDARIGAVSGNFLTGITTGDASTYGGVYAYNYNASAPLNLVLGQFGGRVGVGTTTPWAWLSVNPDQANTPTGTVPYFAVGSSTRTQMVIDNKSHVGFGGFAPTLSSCGTSPVLKNGSDNAGLVFVGSGGISACTLTFGRAYTAAPFCFVQFNINGATSTVLTASTTATTLLISGSTANMGGSFMSYHCLGNAPNN